MGRIQKHKKRVTRLEAQLNRKAQIAYRTQGTGLYIYRNRTQATLQLPKKSSDGKTVVGPNEEWQGDNYFMFMLSPPVSEAVLVKDISDTLQPQKQEKQQMNEKLILDQPDKVTTEGTVEQVMVSKAKPINEANPATKQVSSKEVLLNDDASDGVEIILG